MYCDKENVNILSALLPQAGVTDVVVCPGSRNGVLVHNLERMATENGSIRLCPVTDERIAAFVALGISVAHGCCPVAVCVTSGSALLGTLPAAAEAYYRHVPLLVISADRPARWVGQLDGQTLPQVGALMPYCQTYVLPEPFDADGRLWCRDVASDALTALGAHGGKPVHINVPISEPLFTFNTTKLPNVRLIERHWATGAVQIPESVMACVKAARLPVLIVGHTDKFWPAVTELEAHGSVLVLPEIVGNQRGSWRTALLEANSQLWAQVSADLVIHVGGNLVNKQLKLALRNSDDVEVIRIEEGEDMPDTFAHLSTVLHGDTNACLKQIADTLPRNSEVENATRLFAEKWKVVAPPSDGQTSMMAQLSSYIQIHSVPLAALHLSNSTVVRSATKCFDGGDFPICCNRGVNGIEGSVSTAVGYALATEGLNLLLTGDLSFFYDQNGLWNKRLRGNLRIVLFNNGGGRIFDRLPGLSDSPARDTYIAAAHTTKARGIAESYGLEYLSAESEAEFAEHLDALFAPISERPVLLEVFLKQYVNQENNGKKLDYTEGI